MKTHAAPIELLESRIAPAVILNLIVGKTGVTLAEDTKNPGENLLNVSVDATGALHIDPVDVATQISINNGTPLAAGEEAVIPGFTGNFTAKLGAGNDQLNITGTMPGAVTVDLGVGDNGLTLTSATVGGKLTAKGGVGADTVSFGGTTTHIYGAVNLTLGEGGNTLNNTTSTLLHVGGDFIATSGKANDDFLMAGKDVQILGKLSLTTGAGSDDAGFDVTGRLDIARDVSLKSTGLATLRTDQALNGANVFVGGAVTMDVKAGFANQDLVSAGTIFIGGAAKFSCSGKDSFTDVQLGAVAGSPTVMHIGGLLSATAKGPSADFAINDVAFGSLVGGLNVSGFTEVIAELSGSIGGAVKVALAGGQDGYFFAGTQGNATVPLFLNAVTVTTKTDGATLSLLGVIAQGAVKMKGSAAADTFAVDDVLFLGATTIDLGAGDDDFHVEDGNSPTGFTQVNAPLTLLGGAGEDSFSFSGGVANRTLNAVATILVDGGADTDTVTLGANGNYQVKLVQKNV